MALVNPNIAMSYRPTVEYQPRNALADYAQVQQIMGGQRQMEMADMQMEDLRRERDALSRIQAAIVSKGGPPDLAAAADEMIRTGRPQFVNQGIAIQESLRKQEYFNQYEKLFGAGRFAPATPSTAPGAITGAAPNGLLAQATSPTTPAAQSSAARPAAAPFVPKDDTAKQIFEEYGAEAAKFYQDNGYFYPGSFTRLADQPKVNPEIAARAAERDGFGRDMEALGIRLLTPEQQAASPYKTLEDFIIPSSRSQTSAGLPSAAAPTNAMLANQASAPPANVNQLASANAGANINDLMQQYSLAAKANHPMAPAILKQIEAALRADPSELRTMQTLGYPLTKAGYEAFRAAQMRETQPGALVPILQNGRPVLVPRDQAVGQTPFSPASVQVLGMGQGRETSDRAPTTRAPTGYRFTPTGDLEPIPGGPAAPGLTPQEIQKREATFPQATQSINNFQTKSEQFIAELLKLRNDPGLDQITGPIYGRTPSVSRAGSRAQALYDKIFAKGGFQALQDMREASKTGGALGNVSNEEGRRLEKSIVGGLDRTQNIADVQQGIDDLIAEIKTSQARVRDAYDTTYEYRKQRSADGATRAPTSGTARQLSPQDKQALDWANSNPRDPRAAEIKARLGVQ